MPYISTGISDCLLDDVKLSEEFMLLGIRINYQFLNLRVFPAAQPRPDHGPTTGRDPTAVFGSSL